MESDRVAIDEAGSKHPRKLVREGSQLQLPPALTA